MGRELKRVPLGFPMEPTDARIKYIERGPVRKSWVGYQMWQTVNDRPYTPTFATPEELARWCADHPWGAHRDSPPSYETWLQIHQRPQLGAEHGLHTTGRPAIWCRGSERLGPQARVDLPLENKKDSTMNNGPTTASQACRQALAQALDLFRGKAFGKNARNETMSRAWLKWEAEAEAALSLPTEAAAPPQAEQAVSDFQLESLFDAVHEHGVFGRGFRERAREILAASPQSPDVRATEGALTVFDKAVADELPLVSSVPYNSHEICEWFASNLRARLAAMASTKEQT